MIGLLQRVSSARIEVGGQLVGAFDYLAARARAAHSDVQTGRFGADMRVSLVNEGPVTFWLEGQGKGVGPRTQDRGVELDDFGGFAMNVVPGVPMVLGDLRLSSPSALNPRPSPLSCG